MHTSLTTVLHAKIILFHYCTKLQVGNDFNSVNYILVLTVYAI